MTMCPNCAVMVPLLLLALPTCWGHRLAFETGKLERGRGNLTLIDPRRPRSSSPGIYDLMQLVQMWHMFFAMPRCVVFLMQI